jgi:hypothetical protein
MLYKISYHHSISLKELNEPLDEPDEFVNVVSFEINEVDNFGDKVRHVGKGKVCQVLFSLALDLRFPSRHVMDATQSIFDMSGIIFDLNDEVNPWSKLEEHYDEPFLSTDICMLDEIEILPDYRNRGLMPKIMKELIIHFYGSCGLWVLKAFPFQHDDTIYSDDNKWFKEMDYIAFEEDFEKSQYKLFHLFQSLGFENPFDPEYFIARPFDLLKQYGLRD